MDSHALIDYGRLLDVVEFEGELLTTAAHGVRPDAAVPACPGLTVRETVRHVGSVYRAVTGWIRDGRRPVSWPQDPAPGQPVEEYLHDGLDEMMRKLSGHDPAEPCATWWPEHQNYGFWRRRMAHETTIHRTDVESAAGTGISEIAEDVAVDGIDEVLLLWFGHRLSRLGVSGTRHGTIGIRTGQRRWLARAGPSEAVAWRAGDDEPGAHAEVTATPMELYLWLWGRRPLTAVHVDGQDDDAVAQVWALLRLATR